MIALPVARGGCRTGGFRLAPQADIDHPLQAMRTLERFPLPTIALAVAAAGVVVGCAMHVTRVAIPSIEPDAGWQLSQGCQVRKFGLLTAPDCDILRGEGITVQITRIRLPGSPPGEEERSTIGIELRADRGAWTFASPYVELLVGDHRHVPSDLDAAIVFAKAGRPTAERLEAHQQRYPLPPGERRFFRLRFAIPQDALGGGFALRITGLQRDGEALPAPLLRFKLE